MGVLALARRWPIAAVTGDFSADAARMATQSPKEVAVTTGGNRFILLDLGQVRSVDTIVIGYSNAQDGDAIDIGYSTGGATTALGTIAIAHSRVSSAHRHFAKCYDAPFNARYIRLSANWRVGMSIGVLAAGKAIRPSLGHELGGGRFVIDTGSLTRLFGGGFGFNPGARAGGWQFTMGDLTETETDAVYDLQRLVGTTESIVAIEDPDPRDGLNERIHWGPLTKLEPYGRREIDVTRWSLRIEDWL